MAIRFSLGTVRIGTCCKGNGLPHQRARWFAMTVVVGTLAEPSYVRAQHLRSRGPKDVRLPPKVRNAFSDGSATQQGDAVQYYGHYQQQHGGVRRCGGGILNGGKIGKLCTAGEFQKLQNQGYTAQDHAAKAINGAAFFADGGDTQSPG